MATAAFAKLTGAVDNGKSYNVEKVLRSNIVYSDYYRQLCKVTDFMTLVDEMYNEVTHVEPWMSGNARGPSTAFCILYRLFTLAPTVASEDGDGETQMLEETQIAHLLNHGDSPYIRAIGFLYLRYVCPHKKLIKHLEPYFADDEKFAPTADPNKETTIGAFVRDLVLDQYYFETIFPRIPEVTRRELVRAMRERGYAAEAGGLGIKPAFLDRLHQRASGDLGNSGEDGLEVVLVQDEIPHERAHRGFPSRIRRRRELFAIR